MTKFIKKLENGNIIPAPKIYNNNGEIIFGYNNEVNMERLLADGYIVLPPDKNITMIDIVNGEIVDLPTESNDSDLNNEIIEISSSSEIPHIFSRLQIRRALRSLDMEDVLDNALNSNEIFRKDWNDADEINLNDSIFNEAISQLPGMTPEFLNQIIMQIVEHPF